MYRTEIVTCVQSERNPVQRRKIVCGKTEERKGSPRLIQQDAKEESGESV